MFTVLLYLSLFTYLSWVKGKPLLFKVLFTLLVRHRICSLAKPTAKICKMNLRWVAAQCAADLVNHGGPPGCRRLLCWSKAEDTQWTFVPACISLLPLPSPAHQLSLPPWGENSVSCQKATTLLSQAFRGEREGDDVRTVMCLCRERDLTKNERSKPVESDQIRDGRLTRRQIFAQ